MVLRRGKRSNADTAAGGSRALDLDGLLQGRPEAKRAAEMAEAAAAFGGMVRRMRMEKGISQSELARKIGCTQPHLSELERGLGANGPTIATIVRIIRELGDKLIVDTKNERSRRESEMMTTARALADDVASQFNSDLRAKGINYTVVNLSKIGDATAENPFAVMFAEGIKAGAHMALGWLPDHSASEIQATLQPLKAKSLKTLVDLHEMARQKEDEIAAALPSAATAAAKITRSGR
jgi:transcriptional regulator with XRE-family HTH domain